jgi:hypothetical protein
VLSEAQGIPLAVAVSSANVHDSQAFKPLLLGLPAIRSRRGPRRRRPVTVRADKAYYSAEHLAWLRSRGLIPRIARPGIESGERLGRHRWKIERSIAWLFGYRRLIHQARDLAETAGKVMREGQCATVTESEFDHAHPGLEANRERLPYADRWPGQICLHRVDRPRPRGRPSRCSLAACT